MDLKQNENRFGKGQKVVCINNEYSSVHTCSLQLGEVYTIENTYKCQCGSDQLILKEEKYGIYMVCQCGHEANRTQSYYTWRFRLYFVS